MARVAHKMSTTRHRNQTPAISQARNPYRKWRCELSRSSHSSRLPNDRLWKLRKVKPSAKKNIAISSWSLDRAVAGVAPRLRSFCRLRHASDLCRGDSCTPPSIGQRPHAFARRVTGRRASGKLSLTAHGESAAGRLDMRGSRLELVHAIDLPVHAFQCGGEHLLALQGVLGCARKACTSLRPFSAHRTAIFARQGALLITHLAQTLAQRLEVIKRSVIDFRMVTAQDDLMLVIAENAALEFAGYGHGGPLVSCAAANEDWYYGHPPYQYSGERALVAGCAMAVNVEPAWRNKPMSGANANPAADGITWHSMAVDQVGRRLTTDIEKGLDAGEASSRLHSSLSVTAHLGNKYLPLGIGAVVILQLLFTNAPPLQRLFDNEAIPLWVWPWLVLGGVAFFLVVEAEKLIIRSSGSLRSAVTA